MVGQAAAVNVTTTATVYPGPCTYRGLSIGSTAGATVVVYDGTAVLPRRGNFAYRGVGQKTQSHVDRLLGFPGALKGDAWRGWLRDGKLGIGGIIKGVW